MVYDSARQVVVLFGGFASPYVNYDDTWEWDGTQWTQAVTATRPPGRTYHAMAYDAARGVTVMLGGRVRGYGVTYDDT